MKDSTFELKAYGKRVNKIISIEGRVQFDLLQVRGKGGDGEMGEDCYKAQSSNLLLATKIMTGLYSILFPCRSHLLFPNLPHAVFCVHVYMHMHVHAHALVEFYIKLIMLVYTD